MNIPDHVNAHWIATLGDDQLVAADLQLHVDFQALEAAEKFRMGEQYVLLRSPPPLVNAWIRGSLVATDARERGLVVRHPR